MKLSLLLLVFFLVGCPSEPAANGPSAAADSTGDCRPGAEIVLAHSGAAEITFYRSLGEVVDGQVHCDFRRISTNVANPTINGKAMRPLEKLGETVYTISDASIDMTRPVINCELDGSGYITDPQTMKTVPNGIEVRLRQFPPK